MKKADKIGVHGTIFLIILGLGQLYLTGFFEISNTKMFHDYILKHGVPVTIAATFIILGIIGLIRYIIQALYGEKYEIMYLNKIENNTCDFINKYGKHFSIKNNNLEVGECYHVLRTYNDIKKINGISSEKLDIMNKRNYWYNCYIFGSKMENTFLLPVLYMLMIPGIYVIISAKGIDKLVGLAYCCIPLILIVYDIIYKIHKNKRTRTFEFNKAISKIHLNADIIVDLLIFSFANAILIDTFVHADNRIFRLIIGLLTFYDLCALGNVISRIFDSQALKKFFGYIATIIFYIYFFGFLIQFDILALQDHHYALVGFSGCFWVIGIVTLIFIHFIKHD